MTDFFDKSKELTDSIFIKLVGSVGNPEWESIRMTVKFDTRDVVTPEAYVTVSNVESRIVPDGKVSIDLFKLEKLLFSEQKGRVLTANFKINNKGNFDVRYEYENK